MAQRRLLALALMLTLVVPIAWLSWALLTNDRNRAAQTLLERDLLTLSVSWRATQLLQRNSVVTYFEEYVRDDPRTLALLQAAQDPEQTDLARLHLFRHLSPAYARLVERGVRQFHFHRPNGDSFLRFHHPARFGDNLLAVRASIQRANTELESVFGFEVGRVVSGYRSLFPIIDAQGSHLGSVELSLPFKVLMDELQALMPQVSFQLLLLAQRQRRILFDEQQSLYEAWPASERFLVEDPHRLRSDSPAPLPDPIPQVIKSLGEHPALLTHLHQGTEQAFRLQAAGRDYAVLQTPIIDPAGEQIGLLLAYVDEPGLTALDQAFQLRLILVGVVLAVLSLILLWLLWVLDQRLSERNRLQVITDTLGQGLYLTDAKARIIRMNPHGRALLDYPESALLGASAHDLFHRHQGNAFESDTSCPILATVRAGREYRAETRFRRADGQLLDVFVVSRPLLREDQYVGAVTLFEDIGERKQAECALAESRQRLANIIWGTGVGTWEWNLQTGETRFNERWAEIIGYRLEELEPVSIDTWLRLSHPEDLAESQAALARHFAGETDHYEAEVRVRHRSGDWICVLDRGRVITRTPDGQPEWIVGTHLDITARKRAELAVRQTTRLLQAALESSPSGILIAEAPEQRIRFANRPALELLAIEPNRLSGPSVLGLSNHDADWQVLHPDGQPMLVQERPLTRAMNQGETVTGEEAILVGVDGRQRWVSLSAAPIKDDDGRISAGIVVLSDISAQKEVQHQLQRSAHYDALTGLPNRVLLSDRLEQAMARSRRSGYRLAVAFIDLDEFKPVNDEYGHAIGDQLLITLARRMRDCLRGVDTLARLGGDEFVAVLCDLADASDAQVLVERLLEALSAPVQLQAQINLRLSGSIGLTLYPQPLEQDVDQLLHQADQAMYQAKLKGRNAWCLFAGATTSPAINALELEHRSEPARADAPHTV
ncbi:MAG: diguanylate cyclase [Lamprobacter sp.]|uniref:diguanylate cyclase domain-containing protein n=1 Tax=Lamprobacter sp. TaxID=3100796 RepID=UPI002B25FC6A|nr:diguanylate cyclase [Lamprobacter sp.]MEA3640714.1 diguanylate cyclase [Lamprobacter sp.]